MEKCVLFPSNTSSLPPFHSFTSSPSVCISLPYSLFVVASTTNVPIQFLLFLSLLVFFPLPFYSSLPLCISLLFTHCCTSSYNFSHPVPTVPTSSSSSFPFCMVLLPSLSSDSTVHSPRPFPCISFAYTSPFPCIVSSHFSPPLSFTYTFYPFRFISSLLTQPRPLIP
jgi:hypothetical protein